jgi:hypothetical protein
MKKITLLKSAGILAGLALTNMAHAAFPAGLWQVVNYDFVTKAKINTVQVCISNDGTMKAGLSMLSIDSTGNWKKNGDLILMRVNNTNGSGSGAFFLTVNNTKLMTGYNQSWGILSTSEGFYTTGAWTFRSTTC